MDKVFVTDQVISAAHLATLVQDNKSGAVVTFSGEVRNHDGGKDVATLTYEIHPSAQEVLASIVSEVSARFAVNDIAVAHRYGDIAIGECAFAVAVSADHREAAFNACSALVNTVKEKLPIWKHQVFTDGSDQWVNFA
ncbi:MAG: molybdenum cofactor biosynthesis protein MoaE [Actinobacteria bacterium]|jgi:molybdopterin synthase catalytic subunit|nr:molybdenum cofactor biosynthesis protein MoaE [Actinomycetota bacterium]NDH81441.1 molybdenum cofactor biosynthesis protein MoaE [Actinomycetota bacterium]NDI08426.1 molybdenum cofactor biosynthesis protein MoaE [Actinomycetota bacterium]